MTHRTTLNPLVVLAAFAVCGTITLAQSAPAQQTPAQPAAAAAASASDATPSSTPVERHPAADPGMRPGFQPGGMMHPGMMQGPHNGPGGMHGGFRGAQHSGMATDFHIAPPGMWWRNSMVVQRLALTPDQVKRMDGIFQQSRLQLIDLKANVKRQNAMLEPLLSANPPDTVKAMAQIDKVAEARADLEKADAKMLLGIRGVLTPDQWTRLSAHRGQGGFGENGFGAGRGAY